MNDVITCYRCGRKTRNYAGWNREIKDGQLFGDLCPACQTPEENAEAEINEATLDYLGVDEHGRPWAKPKGETMNERELREMNDEIEMHKAAHRLITNTEGAANLADVSELTGRPIDELMADESGLSIQTVREIMRGGGATE